MAGNSAAAITQAYQTYLGRAPSADEIAWHVNKDPAGRSVSIIQNSPEAKGRANTPAPAAPGPAPAASPDTSVIDLVNKQNADFQTLLGKQNTEQTGLFDLYGTTSKNQEALPVLYQRLQTELGIPDLSATVQGYKDQINQVQQLLGNLTTDVTARNKGTLTNQAQSDRQIAAEGNPLRTNLANLGYAMAPAADLLSGAQGQLGTLLTLNTQQQAKELHPLELQINAIGDKFAREITGFTTEKQDALTALMDKLTRDRQLSDMEWQNAQDLAKQETDYQHNLVLAKISASASTGGGLTLPTSVTPTSTPVATASPYTATDWASLLGGGGSSMSLGSSSNLNLQGGGIRLQ